MRCSMRGIAHAWRSLVKQMSFIMFRARLDRIAMIVLVTSVVAGLTCLTEPAITLQFRRSVRSWKVAPFVCRRAWIRSLADVIYNIGNIPSVSVVLLISKIIFRCLFFPFVTFLTAVTNPVIARSMIILVGLPTLLLSLFCRLPTRLSKRLPCINVVLTWFVTTALVCVLVVKRPSALHWAVSDLSMTVYLALLAAVLILTTVQEQMVNERDTKIKDTHKKLCRDHVGRVSLYLFAGVVAMWIIQSADSSLAALNVLQDVHSIMR